MPQSHRIPALLTIGIVAVLAIVAALTLYSMQPRSGTLRVFELDDRLVLEVPANAADTSDAARRNQTRFPVHINRPSGPPVIELIDATGAIHGTSLSCSSCHSLREPDLTNRRPADLTTFHENLAFVHGDLSCLSCHNPDDYDALRLADGTRVEYTDVMTLCSQCHGPQARDYAHGAHGGMNGYWDLTRGPRTRNNCVDCHDPHVPAFPSMRPTFKPRDRFLNPPHAAEDSNHD